MQNDTQREQYRRDGYILCRGLLDEQDVARFNERFLDFASGRVPPAERMNLMRDIMIVKGAVEPETPVHAINKILNFDHDETLYSFARHPKIRTVAENLIGTDLYTIATNVFNKPPRVDGRHPLHQDQRYFRIQPPDKIVGVWTALTAATRETGCLCIVPGTHEGELLEHTSPDWEYVNRAFFGVSGVDRDARKHIEMQPGDTLFFHPLLVHGSGSNKTEQFRRAISVHYASSECQSDLDDWREAPNARRVDPTA